MKTVFYVDDNEDDLEFFKIAAESCGASVHLFLDPAAMISAMEIEIKPDIIYLDYNLHVGTAVDVIRNLRTKRIYYEIPIVILSEHEDKAVISLCWKAGANYFITKPRSLKTFEKVLAITLDIDWANYKPSKEDFSF